VQGKVTNGMRANGTKNTACNTEKATETDRMKVKANEKCYKNNMYNINSTHYYICLNRCCIYNLY